MKKFLLLVLVLICFTACASKAESSDIKTRSRDQLINDFNIVAQNFGALKFSFYTFTLEFERPPENIHELVDTGHLNVKMINPYGDDEVYLGAIGEKSRPGGLYYSKMDTDWGDFECYYVNPNKPQKMRYLKTQIIKYTHQALHNMIFEDDASRPEQLTRVYLLQLNDAIDSYYQKFGHIPESLEEMADGDVNVSYLNPFTKEPVKNSIDLSPGDYMYRKFIKPVKTQERVRNEDGELAYEDVVVDKEFYEVVGWGEKLPIYYYSSDESKDSFQWEDDIVSPNVNVINNGDDEF